MPDRCTLAGVGRRPQVARNRCQTDSAALTEICWPTIERASVTKGLPRVVSHTSGCWGMSFFMIRSRRMSCDTAESQYSGFAAEGVRMDMAPFLSACAIA